MRRLALATLIVIALGALVIPPTEARETINDDWEQIYNPPGSDYLNIRVTDISGARSIDVQLFNDNDIACIKTHSWYQGDPEQLNKWLIADNSSLQQNGFDYSGYLDATLTVYDNCTQLNLEAQWLIGKGNNPNVRLH